MGRRKWIRGSLLSVRGRSYFHGLPTPVHFSKKLFFQRGTALFLSHFPDLLRLLDVGLDASSREPFSGELDSTLWPGGIHT